VQGLYYDEEEGGGRGGEAGDDAAAAAASPAAAPPPDGAAAFAPYTVTIAPAASERLAWVDARSAADVPRLVAGSLSRWPLSSSATRPVAAAVAATVAAKATAAAHTASAADAAPGDTAGSGHTVDRLLPVGTYRVAYTVDVRARAVTVTGVASAMRQAVVAAEGAVDPEVAEHRQFVAAFGGGRGGGGGA